MSDSPDDSAPLGYAILLPDDPSFRLVECDHVDADLSVFDE